MNMHFPPNPVAILSGEGNHIKIEQMGFARPVAPVYKHYPLRKLG
jgi:hypothetical protein